MRSNGYFEPQKSQHEYFLALIIQTTHNQSAAFSLSHCPSWRFSQPRVSSAIMLAPFSSLGELWELFSTKGFHCNKNFQAVIGPRHHPLSYHCQFHHQTVSPARFGVCTDLGTENPANEADGFLSQKQFR